MLRQYENSIDDRAQLAKQAKKSFERVFNNFVSMGIVGDGKHEYDERFIFTP